MNRLFWLLALSVTFAAVPVLRATDLAVDDPHFLTGYVQIHDALIANDLSGAIKAAKTLPGDSGAALAKAGSLGGARDEFAKLTPRAEKLAAGQPNYHIYYCPMAKKDWVQTGTAVANPYLGADMLSCGVEKK